MPKQKVKPTPTASRSSFSNEIQEIKIKNDKINLYLKILEQDLVDLSNLAAFSLSSEINLEMKEFIVVRLKELTGGAPVANVKSAVFSDSEVSALKFIATKFINGNVSAAPALPEKPSSNQALSETEDEEIEEYEEPEPVKLPVKRKTTAKKPVVTTKAKANSHEIRTPVTVTMSDGSKHQEISVTQKIVKPPSNINRIPPPTFEQEYLQARGAVAGFERQAQQLQALPLAGVSDSSEG